jgi:anaerobic selenocysteine-containing dehydrogenase
MAVRGTSQGWPSLVVFRAEPCTPVVDLRLVGTTPPLRPEIPDGATLGALSFRRRHTVPKDYVRLTQPLVRDSKDVPLRPASWDEALTRVVAGFHAANTQHGPTTFGVFSCSKSTNEVNFAAQKFSRAVLGSNNIDSCNRT